MITTEKEVEELTINSQKAQEHKGRVHALLIVHYT